MGGSSVGGWVGGLSVLPGGCGLSVCILYIPIYIYMATGGWPRVVGTLSNLPGRH